MAKLTHEDILAYLEEATILELNDLVKAIEEKFDVTAAAPVAVAAAGADEASAEPANVTVTLRDVQIELDVSSYIPDDFIENSSLKIEIYQNIALCKNEEDIENVTDEIIDRFGRIPDEIENLLDIARIKILCREKSILKVAQKDMNILFFFEQDKFNIDVVDKLMKVFRNRIKFSPAQMPYITFKLQDKKNTLEECKDFLKRL